ncbi:uncharacterized protein LOC122366887 [Amphibalanus amphitrite]|uniref:uncharacterized protein LOC122366887 n=1 Tax=Amphibalanus amphitrite TaxID=1232801 RepID=UPI001C9169E0|nr:uncharacterized protein LOC122366887 [Amphibalanus amphitrite]XP_043195471.1 uncharacterized protein LOC122366887 [Amphibalanus amphitrite]XP_043195472.1 uncharacterized protein LOC122366887 [Amphibalanus amphitrite]XP_043195473.1 uncharacterized protein LOC122366887 [Amphibalanus amphitrite]XP_043195475.1 uncharacterized protein LOC122366887 [Amphibalanus amphitrite]
MELAPEEMDSLRKEMNSLREKVNGLEGEMDDLQQDMAKVREEKAELHLEVARLRRALVEERTARQVAVKELRQEVRRRSAPSDRSQGDGEEELAPLKDDTCDKGDVISDCDVITPSAEEAPPAGGSLKTPVPNIYHLDTELLKMVLSKMDCREMFRARRVCRRWRSAVDDIVSDCRRELTDQQTRDGKVPAPATSLELVLKVQDQPKMTELQAPTEETDTDLRLVASTCHALEKADLCGFSSAGLRPAAAGACQRLQSA